MSRIRTRQTGLTTIILVACAIAMVSFAVGAQSSAPPEPAGAVVVTGEVVSQDFVTRGMSTVNADGVTQVRGWSNVAVWEASDPRLSGDVAYARNYDEYPGQGGLAAETGSYRVSNAGGSWTGVSSSIVGPRMPTSDAFVLTGEDGYEGLSAFLTVEYGSSAPSFLGAIVPGPMPERPTNP